MMRVRLLSLPLLVACATTVSAPTPMLPPGESATMRALVDEELSKAWRERGLTPAPPASDAEFLRRLTIDLTGETPAVALVRAFVDDRRPDKRAEIIERLLASPAFARHWAERWNVLLLGRDARPPLRQALETFLEKALAADARWDRIATSLLTTTDTVAETGAAAFLAHHLVDGGLEKATGVTARALLGLQISCAQCHDHPLDARWKQADFWAFAGYFARTKVDRTAGKGPEAIRLGERRKGEAMLPAITGMGGEPVGPRFLGRDVPTEALESRRDTLARAIVGSDLFAKAAVNRVWAELFGRGLVEAVDDLGAEHDPTHPPLLVKLADRLRQGGFDLRGLVRELVSTQAYARSSIGGRGSETDLTRTFARAAVRPLPPETLVSVLLSMTALDDAIAANRGEDTARRRTERELRQYVSVSGDDELGEVEAFDGNVPQALLLANGELTNHGVRAGLVGGVVREALQATKDRDARLDGLFLAALARPPTVDERDAARATVLAADGRADGYEDVFQALLTSVEATTNH